MSAIEEFRKQPPDSFANLRESILELADQQRIILGRLEQLRAEFPNMGWEDKP